MILCIDTALSLCSVSLSWEGKTISKIEHENAFKASEVLHSLIQQLLAENETTLQDLKAIAVNGGPGSYTGLRIGATTAKGLCYALNIPLIHLDGLQILTNGIINRYNQKDFTYYIPMIDARRMEVFTGIFNRSLETISPSKPVILTTNYGTELKKEKIIIFGNGSEKAESIIQLPNVTFFNDFQTDISDFDSLCWEKYCNKVFENTATYSPNYLKEFYTTA